MIKFIEPTNKDEIIGILLILDKKFNIYKAIAMDAPLKEIFHAYNQYRMSFEESRSDVAKSFCKNLNIELPDEAWNKNIHIEAIVFKNEYDCLFHRYTFVRLFIYDKDKKFADIIPEYVITKIKSYINADIAVCEDSRYREKETNACNACLSIIDNYFKKGE